MNEWQCRDAPCKKQWKPLAILSRNHASPLPTLLYSVVTHDCASILDSIAKGTPCFHCFLHGASLHRHSMIFTLVMYRNEPTKLDRDVYLAVKSASDLTATLYPHVVDWMKRMEGYSESIQRRSV